MSKALVNFLDKSLFATTLVIFTKFISMLLLSRILNIEWSLNEINGVFHPVSTVDNVQSLTTLSSYSDLIVVIVMLIILGFQVIRAFKFHNTHISPDRLLSLSNKNLLFLIKDTYEIYHSSAVWIYFTVIVNFLVFLNIFTESTYLWVGVIALVGTLSLVLLLIKDIEMEIENIKQHPSQYKWN